MIIGSHSLFHPVGSSGLFTDALRVVDEEISRRRGWFEVLGWLFGKLTGVHRKVAHSTPLV